jgi:hypothetical protein
MVFVLEDKYGKALFYIWRAKKIAKLKQFSTQTLFIYIDFDERREKQQHFRENLTNKN